MKKQQALKPGDKVKLVGSHPWKGSYGTLLEYGPYGPPVFGLEGWLVSLDVTSCYAQEKDIRKIRRVR